MWVNARVPKETPGSRPTGKHGCSEQMQNLKEAVAKSATQTKVNLCGGGWIEIKVTSDPFALGSVDICSFSPIRSIFVAKDAKPGRVD